MSLITILLGLIAQFWPVIVGALGFFGAMVFARRSGVKSERDKAARAKLKAAQDRLEMDREATDAEREAARLSDEEARKEALKWAKR